MDKWPGAAVAIALIALVTAVAVTSIIKYPINDFLKVWEALAGIVGVITGAVVTYFFMKATLIETQRQLDVARQDLKEAENGKALAEKAASLLYASTDEKADSQVRHSPAVVKWLNET
jgi:hypothetical protein